MLRLGSLVVLIWIAFYFRSTMSFHREITLSAHEGDSAYIPCSYPDSETISVWVIQDRIYSIYRLPFWTQPRSRTLFIRNVRMEDTGKYVCKTYNGLSLATLYTVHFKVTPQEPQSNFTTTSISDTGTPNTPLRGTVGDVLYLPCLPVLGTYDATVWSIDGKIYPSTRLPPYHVQHYGGLILFNTSLDIVGKVYKCFSIEDNNLKLLDTVDLDVTQKSSEQARTVPSLKDSDELLCEIRLISRKAALNKEAKVFSFMVEENHLQSCPSTTVFKASVRSPTNTTWNHTSSDVKPTFSFPSASFHSNDTYASVEGCNNESQITSRLFYKFRTGENEETNNMCRSETELVCLDLPAIWVGVTVTWQLQPGSDEDCECPLFNNTDPLNFRQCYCFTKPPPRTTFDVNLVNKTLCWSGLTRETNDTKVIIAKTNSIQGEQHRTIHYRNIYNLTRIIIEDPIESPPNVSYIPGNNSLCCSSKNAEWSPIIGTSVTTYDITNDIVRDRVQPQAMFCLPIDPFPETCTPFTFDVSSMSECSTSPPRIEKGLGNGSACKCLQDKVKLELKVNNSEVTQNSAIVVIEISCWSSNEYDILQISNLSLKAIPSQRKNQQQSTPPFNLPCYQDNINISIVNLTASTSYNVAVEWMAVDESQTCVIVESHMLFYTLDTDDSKVVEIEIATIVPIGITVLVILFTVLIYCTCCKKKEKNIQYQLN